MTEPELIDRCREGDRHARHELYQRTCDRIYRLVLKMTGNRDDAFDVAQNVYLRAFEQIHRFQGRSSLFTWLYRIAVNEALQFLKRRNRTKARGTDAALDARPDPDVDARTTRWDINEALAALNPQDMAILLLRYHEERDYREIGRIIGCPPGTVGSRLNRARKRLRERLGKSYDLGEAATCPEHPMEGREIAADPRFDPS